MLPGSSLTNFNLTRDDESQVFDECIDGGPDVGDMEIQDIILEINWGKNV